MTNGTLKRAWRLKEDTRLSLSRATGNTLHSEVVTNGYFQSLLPSGNGSPARSTKCHSPDAGHEFALFHTMKASWGDYNRRWSGMPITPFLAGRTFEPEQITIMSAAFADTCKALRLCEADSPLMPLVAQHVMGLGQRGVKSRTVLYLLTLERFRAHQR